MIGLFDLDLSEIQSICSWRPLTAVKMTSAKRIQAYTWTHKDSVELDFGEIWGRRDREEET